MKIAILAFMLILTTTLSFAEDYVTINSVDGRDVLSGVYYANVQGLPVKFVPKPVGDADLFAAMVGSGHDVLLIQGTIPVTGFVESALQANNNTIELYVSENGLRTNLELAELSGATSFIIVDSAYADSALSVLPYAAMTKSYVLLTDKNNIAEVKEIVSGNDVMIYGYVDEEVRTELAPFNPETIGKGEDKYEDNVLIVDRMMDEFSINRAILADGTFIEDSIVTGTAPLLFTGRIVPSPTYDFVKQGMRDGSLLEVMLLGGELTTPVYDMRERIKGELAAEGLNKSMLITVKFAQMVPSSDSGALGLDMFPMPAYAPYVEVSEVVYNKESGNVMVTIDNLGDGAAYYTTEVQVNVDGAEYAVLTETEAALVERGDSAGVGFPMDISSVTEGEITAYVIVKYGSFKTSLEDFAHYQGELTTVSFVDESNVSVQHAKYDQGEDAVLVTIRNTGNETAYVSSKVSLLLDGAPATVSGAGTKEIDAGSLYVEVFPLELSAEDIAANEEITVTIDYGARRGFLSKQSEYTVALEQAAEFPLLLVGGVVLVLLVVAYFLFGRKK